MDQGQRSSENLVATPDPSRLISLADGQGQDLVQS